MTERMRAASSDYCLLLITVRGILRSEVQFGKEVGGELAAAFAKRLRNSVPPEATAGRWSTEEFVVMASFKKNEAMALAKWISEHLSGSYSCLKEGKTVRPGLQPSVGIVEAGAKDSVESILRRIDLFFGGPAGNSRG
jgi:GGDEF domain-containing protein